MKFRVYFLTLILSAILCVTKTLAAEIPAEHLGAGKWVTLKTENGYYFYAIEEGSQIKLGQTKTAPNSQNYAAYCWMIEGNASEGYTFRCLKYEKADGSETPESERRYISNPSKLATANYEVLLSNTPSRYLYTEKHQLQLKEDESLYLAFYSSGWQTIRLHNSADYVGSRMIIGGINDWSVAAVVYGTETQDGNGLPQGTYLPNGGIIFNGTNYTHGSSLYLNDESLSRLSIISISGYNHSTIKIDKENHYIVAYYIGTQSGITYLNAGTTKDSVTVVTGKDNTIWTLNAKDYITNTSGKYTTVPASKAWEMEMVVQNTNTSGPDPSFNKWGSCILSSCGDPLNTYYWGDFQVYQHAPTHSSPNTLNFKSSKGDGNDHIIAQGISVANRNYKVIVRYNGASVYVIRTILLDNDLTETNDVYNNVWVTARPQVEINQMSCALPTGINLKSLRISIAEESNLLQGMDYAIQNIGTSKYLTIGTSKYLTGTIENSIYAGDAAKFQIEWTYNEDLTYAENQDGGLHNSFYIKLSNGQYVGADTTLVEKSNAQAFIYTTNQCIAPITNKNTLSQTWSIGSNDTWLWDFFANFYVEVAGNNAGGLLYQQGGEQKTATNGKYLELPSGVQVNQLANSSQAGYMAAISKSDIRLKVQYTPLENTFYNFTEKSSSAKTLYYWYKGQNKLITYSTTNSQSGQETEWGDKGDCSKFTIEKETEIPMKMLKVGDTYYSSVYCPNALTLPEGVTAYRLNSIKDNGNYLLKPIEGQTLSANTPAILRGENLSNDPSGSWTIEANNRSQMTETNLFKGVFEDIDNPGSEQQAQSTVYVLGNKSGIGFYPYSGATIPAFKAYHKLESTPTSAPVRFNFSFEDDQDATNPESLDVIELNNVGAYHNMMGHVVEQPIHGQLYIRDGKKIIY